MSTSIVEEQVFEIEEVEEDVKNQMILLMSKMKELEKELEKSKMPKEVKRTMEVNCCVSMTKKNEQCKNQGINGTDKCRVHSEKVLSDSIMYCCAITKSKNVQCTNKAKYGKYCGVHTPKEKQ